MLINILKFILLAYIVTFCQTILANVTQIAGVSPDYATIIILLIVLKSRYQTAFAAAFMVGLLIDVLNPELLGVGLAVRFAIAVGLWEMKRKMDLGRISTKLYLVLGAEAVFQLIYQTLVSNFNLGMLRYILLSVSLPTILYTTVVGLVVVLLSDLSIKVEIRKGDSGTEAL